MLIFNYIDPFSNSLLRFDFVVAIKLFETFSIFEFVRIGYHINSASKGKKYIDKRNQFLIDVVSISAVSLAPFFIVLNSYDDFFKVNSLLLHSQVTGYKYFDAIIVLVHIVGFFIILKEIGPRNKMEQYQARIIKSASMFALFQKILQIINIIFFNYTILLFVYIEWVPTLFSAWTILYYMFKDSNKEGY